MTVRTAWAVFAKELTELGRDPKALLVSLALPALLMPLMFALLASGVERTSLWLEEGVPVAIAPGESRLEELIRQSGKFLPVEGAATEERLLSGRVALLLIPEAGGASIVYDSRSQRSLAAAEALTAFIESARGATRASAGDPSYRVVRRSATGTEESTAAMLLSMVLPILLLVACAVTPLAAAADFGAGEKERGTLEPLLTTPLGRWALLLGKQAATWVMAMAGALSFFTGSLLAYLVAPQLLGAQLTLTVLSPGDAALLLLLTSLLALIFSAAELTLSFLARSVREAHSFFLPLLIVAVSAGYATFGIDPVHSSLWNFAIPLANIPLAVKAIVLRSATPAALLVTVGVALAVAATLLYLGSRMLRRESLLFRV